MSGRPSNRGPVYRMRVVATKVNGDPDQKQYGIRVPRDIGERWLGRDFHVKQVGSHILLEPA